ncbi:Ribose-phosphate pyrophosphokinase 1 [Phlyctochytrium bullatum]|nr:Ribose-phosphate pyrophosphokinase 1 [Phlyctochytrium bullatum]
MVRDAITAIGSLGSRLRRRSHPSPVSSAEASKDTLPQAPVPVFSEVNVPEKSDSEVAVTIVPLESEEEAKGLTPPHGLSVPCDADSNLERDETRAEAGETIAAAGQDGGEAHEHHAAIPSVVASAADGAQLQIAGKEEQELGTTKEREDMRGVKIFAGSSHPELAALILERLGQTAAPAVTKKFANQETLIEIGVSVRGEDVYIIQSGSSSINDHIMELLIMVNACKLASARKITAVIPYYPYMKQSKKKKARGSITAKLLANMLVVAGVDHVITMDLHSSQIQGFFSKPVDNLLAEPAICQFIQLELDAFGLDVNDGCIVCKNAGGAKRVTSIADRLKMDFALIHRERFQVGHKAQKLGTVSEEDAKEIQTKLTLVGSVKDKVCFVVDDVIDGTHSFLDTAEHLKRCEARRVVLIATHGILSNDGLKEIEDCDAVDMIAVTNTYPIAEQKRAMSPTKLKVIDVSGVLAEAIRRTHNGESISYLFSHVLLEPADHQRPNLAPSEAESLPEPLDITSLEIHSICTDTSNCTIERGSFFYQAVVVKRSSKRDIITRELDFFLKANNTKHISDFLGWFEDSNTGITGLVTKCAVDLKEWSANSTGAADLDRK